MKTSINNTMAFLFGLLVAAAPGLMPAQTFIWGDEFEYPAGNSSPTSGTRIPSLEGGGGSDGGESVNAYFGRCFLDSGNWVVRDATENPATLEQVSFTPVYASFSDTCFWAGEQHDIIPTNSLQELEILWTGIPISGYSNIQFRGLFAASGSLEENEDVLVLEYKINGTGNYVTGLELKRSEGGAGPWSVNGAGQVNITKTFQTITFSIPGTGNTIDLRLRVKIDDQGDEWAVDKFQLVSCNVATPAISIQETSGNTNNDGTICLGDNVVLSVGTYNSYSWSSGASSQSINVSPATTTTYSVTVTQSGCPATNSQQIIVNPNPSVTITLAETSAGTNNDGTICSGDQVTLSVGSFNSYSWSPGGATTQSINVNPTSTTTFSVTVTNAFGCEDNDSQAITITAPQAHTLTTTDGAGPFCANGTPRTMRMSDTNTGVSYQLKRDGANVGNLLAGTGSAANFSPPQDAPGVYTVEATATNTGCSGLMNGSVSLIDPAGTVDAGPDLVTCEEEEVTLNGSIGGSGDVEWTASVGGGSFDPDKFTLTAGYTPPAGYTGTITLTLSASNPAPCPEVEDALVLTVHPKPTAVIAVEESTAGSTNDGVICSGTSVILEAGTASAYSWSPGGATSQSITETPEETVTYTVTITDSNGCTDTDNQIITVRVTPVIAPIPDMTIQNGGTASFEIDASPAPIDLMWEVETNNIDEAKSDYEPEGTSSTVEGEFSVESKRAAGQAAYTIVAEKNGCLDTLVANVWVFPLDEGTPGEDLIFIPELLTPDGDGVNDEWIILLPGERLPEEYSVIVRDRTGCLIHEGTLAERLDTSRCPNGVYYYVITDEEFGITYKGAFTVITTN